MLQVYQNCIWYQLKNMQIQNINIHYLNTNQRELLHQDDQDHKHLAT